MPSFLTDENLPVFSSNLDVVNLNHFEVNDKDLADHQAVTQSHASQITESLDERSTISTRDSDTYNPGPTLLNGNSNGTRPTSMGSITNGVQVPHKDDAPATSGANGTIKTAPNRIGDAAYTPSPQDEDIAPDAKFPETRKPLPASDSAELLGSQSATPTDYKAPALQIPESSSAGDAQALKARTASLTPGAHAAELVPPKSSPHRFSSPPAYQPGNAPLNASPSGHLLPPSPAPPLKQRHTLEMQKPAPGRTSQDTAHATGRFSPSVANRRTSMNLGRRNTRSAVMDLPRDEVAPDEDALRWAEAYRQKRASKRRRKVEEDDDRVLVGTKVDETHANWVTAYNMLTGIRVSVSRTNAKLDRELTDADFEAKQKSTFDM